MPHDDRLPPLPPLVLRPARLLAAVWTALGTAGIAGAVWIVRDSSGAPLAWLLLAALCLLTVVVLVPLVAPGLVTLTLDEDGLSGRVYGRRVVARWEDVAVARVTEVAGEPILELHEVDPDGRPRPNGEQPTVARGILLPLGADLDALDRFLARRLGRRSRRP